LRGGGDAAERGRRPVSPWAGQAGARSRSSCPMRSGMPRRSPTWPGQALGRDR
jgi:hypothetical protein